MPAKDGFTPDRHFSLFLSGHVEEHKQRGSSRLLRASILVIAATVIGIAITLSLGNPVKVLADVTASLTDILVLQPVTYQSTPTIQSTADAQALPPTATGAPPHDVIAAAFEPADQKQTKISEPPNQALLKQFQAWAAKEGAQARLGPVQPAQDAPAKVLQNAPAQVAENAGAPVHHLQRHRHIRSLQSARAEIRSAQRIAAAQNRRAYYDDDYYGYYGGPTYYGPGPYYGRGPYYDGW
jgi:hypothetical protein